LSINCVLVGNCTKQEFQGTRIKTIITLFGTGVPGSNMCISEHMSATLRSTEPLGLPSNRHSHSHRSL